MYARRVGEKELTFDFADGLLKNNLLIVDRETGSVWSQLHGKAVLGPMKGTPLVSLPSMQTTWKFWRERHPDSRVMLVPGEKGRPYFYRATPPGKPAPRSASHNTSTLELGLVAGGEAIFFPFRELARASTRLSVEVGGETIRVFYRKEALTAWAEDRRGDLLPAVLAYEEGWKEFFLDSRRFRAERR